jgi:FAD/FMN-containing dehydrogenase
MSAIVQAAQADLLDRLGRERVLVGEPARRQCGFEPTGREGPVAVVRPGTAEQVEQTIKIGRLRHLPVETRGRLPSWATDELRDAIVLDLSGLARAPAIDIGRRVATVGAGVDVAVLDRAARQARLSVRGLPAYGGDAIGTLLAAGEPGELGLGEASLLADVVSALVVTGGGRILRLGASDLLGQPSWLGEGAPQPLPMLLGAEGRMAVWCEVTLRLQRAPFVAWSTLRLPWSREGVLAALTAGRKALSARVTDTVLVTEADGHLQLDVRAVTWRGEDDLAEAILLLMSTFDQHALRLPAFASEDRRVRLGAAPPTWPKSREPAACLDLRVAWPDAPAVLDTIAALSVEAPVGRGLALGLDGVRLRCVLPGPRPEQHPLIQRATLLLDAGAVPMPGSPRLRQLVRERTPPAAKVLLQALARAWDPDGVLAERARPTT